jgi:hypothetical protein
MPVVSWQHLEHRITYSSLDDLPFGFPSGLFQRQAVRSQPFSPAVSCGKRSVNGRFAILLHDFQIQHIIRMLRIGLLRLLNFYLLNSNRIKPVMQQLPAAIP